MTEELNPWGKENDKIRQGVFFTPLNAFGNNPDEEKHHDDLRIPQNIHYKTYGKHNQDAVHWIKLSTAQDLGLQFVQTKSFAIITPDIVGDCIRRVISQIGDGLSTPRPAPKVTLKRNGLVQQQRQQQQPVRKEGVSSIFREMLSPGKAEQEREMKRKTSLKWKWTLETVREPLQKWTLVLISADKKSSQIHSWITKLILKKWKDRKLIWAKFVFAKT